MIAIGSLSCCISGNCKKFEPLLLLPIAFGILFWQICRWQILAPMIQVAFSLICIFGVGECNISAAYFLGCRRDDGFWSSDREP